MRAIDKFKKTNKPLQRSKLSELDEDILELLRDEFKPKQIHEYITSHRKISVDLSHLYKYIKKLQARDNPIAIDKSKATVVATPAKVTTASATTTIKADEPAIPKKRDLLENAGEFRKQLREDNIEPSGTKEWKPRESRVEDWNKRK